VASLLAISACPGSPKGGPAGESSPIDAAETAEVDVTPVAEASAEASETTIDLDVPQVITVTVTLDGEPLVEAPVIQGGTFVEWLTGRDGKVAVTIDRSIPGLAALISSHQDARTRGVTIDDSTTETAIQLQRFDRSDNPEYEFQDPGSPETHDNTSTCGHCHLTINETWYESIHRRAAQNPTVQDLYWGTAAARADETACKAASGIWATGPVPGGGPPAPRCWLGRGVLPSLNGACQDPATCVEQATETGGCADCHAPGIDGKIGGRGLHEATGVAYEHGVHCDVCHRVEAVVEDAEPGVRGWLKLLRPAEKSTSTALGKWKPLTFGPSNDTANVRMGMSPRGHFHEARLCAGCHQQEEAPRAPGSSLDPVRWPTGKLPIQSTFAEWKAGPMNPASPCQECHMPPDPMVSNGADLQEFPISTGIAGGWPRPPGAVRMHAWFGPRWPGSRMLQLAAAIFMESAVEADEVVVTARVKNVGAGHAIPTGEPMRSLVLLVEARCDGKALVATGGDAVPDFGGYLDRKASGTEWTLWPGAQVGEVIRVVSRPGGSYDYKGYGPFGDGTFDAMAKGMPVEKVVGQATIATVTGDTVTFDGVLPHGDLAYRVPAAAWPVNGDPALGRAGASGFGFARVTVGPDGARQVPAFMAADIASDNRLLPQTSWTSEHRFHTTCAAPTFHAVLLYRAYPLALAAERAWTVVDTVMAEARR
jgi:hypothetical protein